MKHYLTLLITLFIIVPLHAQIAPASAWNWVSGNNTYTSPGVYGTLGVPGPLNAPGARNGSISWTDKNNKLWLFGGFGIDASGIPGLLNDLWQYDPATNQWTWISGSNTANQPGIYGTQGIPAAGNNPGARTNSVTWTDNAGNLFLFGGTGYDGASGNDFLSDVWIFNIALNEWTWLKGNNTVDEIPAYGTMGIASAVNSPGARSGSSGWVDTHGNFWLFGGFSQASYQNDLWEYNPATNQWVWQKGNTSQSNGVYGTKGISSPLNTPGSRHLASSWTDIAGNLWLFGGLGLDALNGSPGYLNDLWKFNTTSKEWVWISGNSFANGNGSYGIAGTPSAANLPGARQEAFSFTDVNGNLLLYGGFGHDIAGTNGDMGDLWSFDIGTAMWTWQKGNSTVSETPTYGTKGTPAVANTPGARRAGFQWTTPNTIYLFGGNLPGGYVSDLWSLSLISSTLPLQFESFTATLHSNEVVLNWVTTQEVNTNYFSIEISKNGRDFSEIGKLPAGGNSTLPSKYSFIQKQPAIGNNFYRIKEVDKDGSNAYSIVRSLDFHSSSFLVSLKENPFVSALELLVSVQEPDLATFILRDLAGRKVLSAQMRIDSGTTPVNLPANSLHKGTYLLTVYYKGFQQTVKVVHE